MIVRLAVALLLLLLLALLLISESAHGMEGGMFADIETVPYQAQIGAYFQTYMSFCGATIISQYWLVSAAHCFRFQDAVYEVRVGSNDVADGGTVFEVDKIVIHGSYTDESIYDSDIALIKVVQPIKFNKYQQPIPISPTAPKANDVITVSGYGYAHEEPSGGRLKIGHTELITSAKCRQNYTVTDNMLCSSIEHLDLCFGDSGGPAVFRGELVGVISQGCEYTAPNVFTKVANYYDWISRVAGLDHDNENHKNFV